MGKPVILTGLRANNDLHLGNYLGALLPIIDMAKQKAGQYQINLFMPDLHSFTTPVDHTLLKESVMNALRTFVAAGLPLDNSDIHIYRQSYVPAHSELAVILHNFTGMGEMGRMTQYKDKSSKLSEDRISVGLFSYPILMAADILLYNASYIPVGEDQTQHLEFTRDIAKRLNTMFDKQLFTIPKPVKDQYEFFGKDQGLRIRDLRDPKKKMSKSDATGNGVMFLTDEPALAKKKIMSATTDSFEEVRHNYEIRPGISNLLDIYDLLGGNSKIFLGQKQYGPLKAAVADKVIEFLNEFQTRLTVVNDKLLLSKLVASEDLMNQQSAKTLVDVQRAVGLR